MNTFLKVVGGIFAFFGVIFVGLVMLAIAGVAVAGSIVSEVVQNVDFNSVHVVDSEGNVEAIHVEEIFAGSESIQINGSNGDQVTIDLNQEEVTIREGFGEEARVVVSSEDIVTISPEVGEIVIDGNEIVVDGRNFEVSGPSLAGRIVGGFFKAFFTIMTWTLILGGIYLLVRNRQPVVVQKSEKNIDATA